MSGEENHVDWSPDIHTQFQRQAKWTEYFRFNIYRYVNLSKAKKILEVGCGTGVITKELRKKTSAKITAIDSDSSMISVSKDNIANVDFEVQDAERLSFRDQSFDIVICNYVLLWLKNPVKAIEEMSRVCKKKGYVVALAEPDYGAWLEYPELELGEYHIKSLIKDGADPFIGRKLKALFEAATLETKINVIAQVWDKENLEENIEEEWQRVYESGLISNDELNMKLELEWEAIANNTRTIFIPVFTAIGRKR